MDPKKFRKTVKIACVKKDITLTALAKKIGYSLSPVTDLLAGKTKSLNVAVAICDYLGLDRRLAYERCGKAHLLPEAKGATT